MKAIWVLVAERSRARLFELESPTSPLRELKDWADAQARLQVRTYETTEAPGRSFDSWGVQRHAMEPRTEPKQKEARRFAAELAHFLRDEHARNRFDRLILVAPPTMLGLLHETMEDTLSTSVIAEVEKSLVKRSLHTIRAHLPSPPIYPQHKATVF